MELVAQNERQYKELKCDLESLSQYKMCRENARKSAIQQSPPSWEGDRNPVSCHPKPLCVFSVSDAVCPLQPSSRADVWDPLMEIRGGPREMRL